MLARPQPAVALVHVGPAPVDLHCLFQNLRHWHVLRLHHLDNLLLDCPLLHSFMREHCSPSAQRSNRHFHRDILCLQYSPSAFTAMAAAPSVHTCHFSAHVRTTSFTTLANNKPRSRLALAASSSFQSRVQRILKCNFNILPAP